MPTIDGRVLFKAALAASEAYGAAGATGDASGHGADYAAPQRMPLSPQLRLSKYPPTHATHTKLHSEPADAVEICRIAEAACSADSHELKTAIWMRRLLTLR